jgi:hypothetical protein
VVGRRIQQPAAAQVLAAATMTLGNLAAFFQTSAAAAYTAGAASLAIGIAGAAVLLLLTGHLTR